VTPGDAGHDRPPRFVFLHGFSQTHHHWHDGAHRIARLVDADSTLAFVDLPGHGLSNRIDDRIGIDDSSRELLDVAGTGTYIGYSMGGRYGLVAAASGDRRVERLVVIGATPGIEDPDERRRRRRLDDDRATRLERLGVDRFLDEWLAMPMFAGLPVDDDGLAHRRRNTAAGLAHSLRRHGTGSQTPVWDRLTSIDVPVLVLAGALDATFAEIGARMAALLPHGTFEPIDGAGHAAHLERPDATARSIAEWVERTRLG
jgi:2-succinyl-6-hydroxy-2,4-cyclohexadiene-1-carboxylate synthase